MAPLFYISILVSVIVTLGVLSGIPAAAAATEALLNWCRSVASFCAERGDVIGLAVIWTALITAASGLIYAAFNLIRRVLSAHLALRGMRVSGSKGPLALLDAGDLKAAFTAGLFKPRVYVTRSLVEALTSKELRQVVLHEIHHVRSKDPLKYLAASFFKDAFYYLPLAAFIERMFLDSSEKAADKYVVDKTEDPVSLASVLVKTATLNHGLVLMGAGFDGASSVETRVKRLLGLDEARKRAPLRAVVVSAVLLFFLASGLTFSATVTTADTKSCTTEHCLKHSNHEGGHHHDVDEDCVKHCEKKR
ncbi:MAG: M56 family metallopeptidase [Deltaproteobacteria bacterium]|nr:M56 family metallopeptidase [Deltaproteobacteria bacterium]